MPSAHRSLAGKSGDTGTITIHDLEVWTRIGVPEAEREAEQRLLVTLSMVVDVRPAAQADALVHGIDYHTVAKRIHHLAKMPRRTLERFAEDCVVLILTEEGVREASVEVVKFPFPQARQVSVRVSRTRP